MRTWRWYSKLLFALLIAAFAYFVWPTPWDCLKAVPPVFRNRLTGGIYYYDDSQDGGKWIGLPPIPAHGIVERLCVGTRRMTSGERVYEELDRIVRDE